MVFACAVDFKRSLKKRTRSSNFSVLFLIVVFASILVMVEAESTANTTPHKKKTEILLVFSDLDGTLIHYPEKASNGNDGILKLPPSSTGMRGEISSKTLSLAQGMRKRGKMLILISGMRTTTLLNRLPFLPRADAYCSEAGGRIFYPTDDLGKGFSVKPKHYDGATEEDMKEFGLVEDMEWRQLMESYTGKFDLDDPFSSTATIVPRPMDTRDGVLWEFARFLTEKGYVLDTKGYSACFRVNKKQQTVLSANDFQALLDGRIVPFSGLETSVNLNCIDVYPSISGKKNCCQYLAEKFCPEVDKREVLSSHAICICDDDNDIEMALACEHAYIPSISSATMAETIRKNLTHFTQTGDDDFGFRGTKASDLALSLILDRFADDS